MKESKFYGYRAGGESRFLSKMAEIVEQSKIKRTLENPAVTMVSRARTARTAQSYVYGLNAIVKLLSKGRVSHYEDFEWTQLNEDLVVNVLQTMKNKGFKENSIRTRLHLIKKIAGILYETGKIKVERFNAIMRIRLVSREIKETNLKTSSERLKVFIDQLQRNGDFVSVRLALIIALCTQLGLKASQIVSLNREDYSKAGLFLWIPPGYGNLIDGPRKSTMVPLSIELDNLLDQYCRLIKQEKAKQPLIIRLRTGHQEVEDLKRMSIRGLNYILSESQSRFGYPDALSCQSLNRLFIRSKTDESEKSKLPEPLKTIK